jgi:hypothetical protein
LGKGFLVLWLFTLGILVSVIYYFLQRAREKEKRGKEKFPLLKEAEFSKRKLEYEALNKNVANREKSTLIVGTIILIASILILVESLGRSLPRQLLVPTVLASLSLYTVWLLFACATAKRINDICYDRMREIENELGIKVHSYIHERVNREKWYRYRSLALWLFFFWVLLLFGIVILLLKL